MIFDSAVIEKTALRRRLPLTTQALLIVTASMICHQSFADAVHFRVAYEDVLGSEEIEAGNLRAGIKELEFQLSRVELESSGDILTTLCAAYIVSRSLDKAERACDKAIAIGPSNAAYNNRGVVRAHKGDFTGAREDFDRVRPRQLDIYLEELWVKDIPLAAEDNFRIVNELLSNGVVASPQHSFAAELEDLND